MNNLPDNWAVYNDGSQRFVDTVCKYLNELHSWRNFRGTNHNSYYGKNGSITFGVSAYTILTIDEFVSLLNGGTTEPTEPKVSGFAKFMNKIENK